MSLVKSLLSSKMDDWVNFCGMLRVWENCFCYGSMYILLSNNMHLLREGLMSHFVSKWKRTGIHLLSGCLNSIIGCIRGQWCKYWFPFCDSDQNWVLRPLWVVWCQWCSEFAFSVLQWIVSGINIIIAQAAARRYVASSLHALQSLVSIS